MKRKSKASAGLCLLLLAACASAVVAATTTAKPDFTGTWVLDQSRSHSIPRDMEQTMTVRQEGDRVTVETLIKTPQGERTVTDTYALDGKETEFVPPPPPQAQQPPGAQAPPAVVAKGRRRGEWLARGDGFVVYDEVTAEEKDGPSVVKTARKWIMWPDGTMTIEIFEETARGDFSRKRLFVRKPQKSS
ncbi:MAG TPA: hypothetical protein VFX96_08330 [Pyrinomonadaceae bacterium]|nr:hypothetical protein [Pyrinomonadaceae bacterium]